MRRQPLDLQQTIQQLEAQKQFKRLSPKRKKLIARMAQAHANPDNSAPDVVVKSMRKARRAQVLAANEAIAKVLGSVYERGAMALEAIGDGEWERLASGT